MKNVNDVIQMVKDEKARSAWDEGVKEYALDLLADLRNGFEFENALQIKEALLNGADNWSQYSYGGCSLIYNEEIAARLCSPSEYKKTRGGDWRPNRNEEWLDVQARALNQACRKIIRLAQ